MPYQKPKELLRVKNKSDNKVQGVIIIKGVIDYGDELKSDDWQLTAALAAFSISQRRCLLIKLTYWSQC